MDLKGTLNSVMDRLSGKKVRYAIVGLGDIAQEDMMPGVEHTGNSVMTALVSDDPEKLGKLKERYQTVEATYSYEQFAEALRSGVFDAIYLATPNWRHAEFVVPALEAGIHVLVEKPLEVSPEKCEEILKAERTARAGNGAKLMVAYRLHFEPGTLDTIEKVRSGELGEVHLFNSTFCQMVDPNNHRAHSGEDAGPVLDMGPYPVNAARYIFSAEPTEVMATGTRHSDSGLDPSIADTVAVTLKFPNDRVAQFTISYYGNPTNSFVAVGTKGSVQLDPAYMFGKPIEQQVTLGEKKSKESFKNTDHFGGELKYFSDCILQGKEVEPDGEEGFADVRVLAGVQQSMKTGQPVQLPPFTRSKRINTETQVVKLSAVSTPELVRTENPARGKEQQPKN